MDLGEQTYGEQLAAVLVEATATLRELPSGVHRLAGRELDRLLPLVDALTSAGAAARFVLTAEAVERGEVAASQAGSTQQWVAQQCPSLDAREAGLVAKAVRELAAPGLLQARTAVAEGRLSVAAGCVVASERRQLVPLVETEAMDAVVAGLVVMGEAEGPVGVRALRPALLARYGLGQPLQEVEDRQAGLTQLSCGHDIGGGITEYRMRLSTEARAVVEAAINTLAAPVLGPDGSKDPRTVEQRRGQALVEVCRRAVAVGSAPAAGVKATVIVTIGLNDLIERTRAGALLGGVDGGSLLGPETVRRLACDASVLPVVVGREGQPLVLGRSRRWFTPAQTKALWLRDRHCTFPGCRVPATWCDAHHLRHWADGGGTDLDNAALLCGRHHTIVHRDRLEGVVTATAGGLRLIWDRMPGSYDRALARGPTSAGAA